MTDQLPKYHDFEPGDLVEFIDEFRQDKRGIGIVVEVARSRFEPLRLKICFPSSKKKIRGLEPNPNRKRSIWVKGSDVRVISGSR
jgi:hypothetical protein